MLKKVIMIIAVAMVSIGAHAARFNAGQDYQVLDLPKTATPTVTEFFSFYCPHCYNSQSLMIALKQELPNNVTFNENPVSFMGGAMGKVLSKGFATAVLLNVEDKVSPVIFNRIHKYNKPPKNEAELRQIFLDEGVTEAQFDGTYNSFAVNAMSNRFDTAFRDTGLRGVPAVVVNGKYHVTPKTIKTEEDYFALVNYLLTL